MNFTDRLHQAGKALWHKSMVHPFIKELESGELPIATFKFYLLQDRYYLREFSKLHGLIATKMDNQEAQKFLLARAQDLKDVEISVRDHFFEELKITATEIAETPVAPTAYNYVNHMHMTLNRSGVRPAVAALLPCTGSIRKLAKKWQKRAHRFLIIRNGLILMMASGMVPT